MLRSLEVENFLLLDHASVEFGAGLNVFTGETGSGKSMVLQALECVLGARAKASFLRSGAERWQIQALFDLRDVPHSVLDSLPDIARDEELVLSRSGDSQGKGKVYINGKLASVRMLEEVSTKLMNVCSQGSHVRLLQPGSHLEILDSFSGNAEILAEYRCAFREWRSARTRLAALEERRKVSEERRGELNEIVTDLTCVRPRAGLRAELEARVKKHSSAETLGARGSQLLQAFEDEEGGVQQILRSVQQSFSEMLRLDSGLDPYSDLLQSACVEFDEFVLQLQKYLLTLELNEEELAELRNQLAEIARLERKYHTDDFGLERLLESSKQELDECQQSDDIDTFAREVYEREVRVQDLSVSLHERRRTAARDLESQAKAEFRDVALVDALLEVDFEGCDLGEFGADRVEFLFSANPGQAPAPLRSIASGGELSRTMLVLQKIMRDRSAVNVLVFDEVDTGISGGVARAVGEKLRELSKDSQVLCITHLPQVASLADEHFMVCKSSARGVTTTRVERLSIAERVEEIARMLSGHRVTEASRSSARELLADTAGA